MGEPEKQPLNYEKMFRDRLTTLRMRKNVSEHRMSLDLNKSGSYIRSISSGAALPSLKETFHIIEYFDMTPAEFFAGLDQPNSLRDQLRQALLEMKQEDLEKVATFLDWIRK